MPEALACDLRLEQRAYPALKAAVAHCEKVGDYVTRELFEDILASEEEHIDFLETQLELIKKVGIRDEPRSRWARKDRPETSAQVAAHSLRDARLVEQERVFLGDLAVALEAARLAAVARFHVVRNSSGFESVLRARSCATHLAGS